MQNSEDLEAIRSVDAALAEIERTLDQMLTLARRRFECGPGRFAKNSGTAEKQD